MPPRKSRKTNREWKPRRRGEPDTPPTVAKSYTLPISAYLAIRKVAGLYGSQGRAVQVGAEILSRLEDPIPVKKSGKSSKRRMTYKLVPRTVKLIHELTESAYESSGETLAACVEALKLKNLKKPKKSVLRESKRNAGK
ncbi:MAG TPA: hypothetical protein VGK24_22025 [Candidatus Angelobacter sp.]|jgi:hypothetical protein